jgi:hypothetical protein
VQTFDIFAILLQFCPINERTTEQNTPGKNKCENISLSPLSLFISLSPISLSLSLCLSIYLSFSLSLSLSLMVWFNADDSTLLAGIQMK